MRKCVCETSCWVGADPGGKRSFGLAFLSRDGSLFCETVSSVEQAVTRIEVSGEPLGLGIDAPMWWSAREGAGRKVEDVLRSKYGVSHGTAQTANSLRGAALVGGALLACRVRRAFPDARITESHPKALLHAFKFCEREFASKYGLPLAWKNEHERDAAIAAVCAREGFERRWPGDFAKDRYDSEEDPESYWLGPMHYFWPEVV